MKTPTQRMHRMLMAAAMALPLFAMSHAAQASETDDMADAPPPAMHGGPGPGDDRNGPDRDGPPRGGPDHGPRMQGGRPPFGGPGFGGPGPGFGGPGMGGRPPFPPGVELSEAQQDKVFAILHAEKPYLREQGKAAAKANEALRALADADKYDDAKAASLAKEAATAMSNIALQQVRTEQKLRAVLTPEQRKQQDEEKDGKDKPRRPRP